MIIVSAEVFERRVAMRLAKLSVLDAIHAGDAAAARDSWHEFSLALQDAQPFTFLMWLEELAAVSDRVQDVRMDARGTLVGIADWVVR